MLDPHLHNDNWTFSILANIYEWLTAFDSEMTLRPALARNWHNPDELTWRFALRQGVRFHDGRLLTSADVVASLDRAKKHSRALVASFLVALESVTAVDDWTIEIRTTRPYPLLANKLTFVSIVPLDAPDEIVQPIGTGPFQFFSSDPDTGLVMRAFSDAWSGPQPWGEVHFLHEPSSTQRVEMWRDGQVDLAMMLESEAAELGSEPEGLIWQDSTAVVFLGFRVDRPPYSDVRIRQAISRGLDRQAGSAHLMEQVFPISQLVSPHVYGHNPEIEDILPDRSMARQLLDEGVLRADHVLRLETPIRFGAHARVIAAQLADIGLAVEVVEMAWPELYRRLVAGDSELFMASYICSAGDASDLFDTALHTAEPERGWGGSNAMGYSNALLDELVEQAARTLVMPERRELFAEVMDLALEDLPLIPLWYSRHLHAVKPYLEWAPRKDSRVIVNEIQIKKSR